VLGLAVGLTVLLGATCALAETKLEGMLRRLEPQTRFQQVCDLEAMKRIAKDESKPYKPDRATTDAVSPPSVVETTMQGTGGAFRSRGKWYQFSFTCRSSADYMKVLSFTYQLGALIPEEKWEEYGLFK
jgi:hypothetical protein